MPSPLKAVCQIIASELGLANDQVHVWDQRFDIPTDYRLYVSVAMGSSKAVGNCRRYVDNGAGGLNEEQYVNMQSMLAIDIRSRGPDARDRKEEVLLALKSTYAQQQMEALGFYVAASSTGFVDLSEVDGPAIPYRFQITVALLYQVSKTKAVQSYGTFSTSTVTTEP